VTAAPGDALASAALRLARRFHAGATLWCWSPVWPSHAEHIAVEFIHPVIVGKPALPAVALPANDAAARLRRSARTGDVFLAIGSGTDAGTADIIARAPAWGIEPIWLAHGNEPPGGTGACVVWLGPDAEAADVVCAYHLLWELTHVCFEHPGVLEVADQGSVCPACSDAGDLGEVQKATDGANANVIVAGRRQRVDLTLVGPCEAGELVMVHAGVAITKLAGAARG